MMHGLGAVGFHQSYTYFTWRNAKWELEEYLRELSHESDHMMRPNFFVNTPDILHAYLQYGGPAAFKIRAALAATGSPSWGVYAGYELFEHVAVRPGSEEYLDSREVPDPGPRLGRRRRRGPHARAVPHPAQRDPPRAPRPAAAAQHRDPQQRRREHPGLLEVSRPARRAERHRDRGRQPRPARDPRDHRPPRPARARPALGRHASRSTTRSPAPTGAGASTTSCGSTPATSPPTS